MFLITGACRHSGNCCKDIQLFDQGVPIDHISDWHSFVTKHNLFKRFQPDLIGESISSFSCNCLSEENKCLDYHNRPNLCRNYPNSFFYEKGFIYSTCGYSVDMDNNKYRYLLPIVKLHINSFYKQPIMRGN